MAAVSQAAVTLGTPPGATQLGHWATGMPRSGLPAGPPGPLARPAREGPRAGLATRTRTEADRACQQWRLGASSRGRRPGGVPRGRCRPVRLDAACYWHIVYTTVVLCFLSCQCYSCLYIRKVPAGACTECRLKRTGRPRQRSSRIREVGAYNSRGSRDDYNKISENQSRPLSHCECFQDRV